MYFFQLSHIFVHVFVQFIYNFYERFQSNEPREREKHAKTLILLYSIRQIRYFFDRRFETYLSYLKKILLFYKVVLCQIRPLYIFARSF